MHHETVSFGSHFPTVKTYNMNFVSETTRSKTLERKREQTPVITSTALSLKSLIFSFAWYGR